MNGVALIGITTPAFRKPLPGLTEPPGPALVVSMYWVVKLAVNVLSVVGATVCASARPSLQPDHTYWIPAVPACVRVVPMMWKEPAGHVNERTPVKGTLSTVSARPGGSLRSVTDTTGAKVAVSLIGPFMITEAGLFSPVKDPGPLPVQPTNVRPALGMARIETTLPAAWNPLAGVTVPPSPALVVSMN